MSARRTAAVFAGAVLVALLVTGCADQPDECEDDDAVSQSLVARPGGTSGGGGGRGTGGGFKPSTPKGPSLTKQRPAKPGTGSGNSSGGASGGKHKSPKVHIGGEDCD